MNGQPAIATAEDNWQPARLIPTSGIKGVDEQERRATSALLSVMMAVPEFAKSLLRKTGAPAGTLKSYIETPFDTKDGAKVRPDGALIIRRGGKEWRAFVEVKTGGNTLELAQIEAYLDLARDEEFNAVLTVSNEMNTAVDSHPLAVAKSKTRKVALHHYSWVEVLTEAVVQREFRGVSDPDQAWILGELIAYLQHEQSGAMHFQDMGQHWVTVRDSVRDGVLRPNDAAVVDVVTRWDQFIQYLTLFLSQKLGVKVNQVLSRKESDPGGRRLVLTKELTESGALSGTLRVQRAAGDITLSASVKARTVTVSVDVDAPAEGKSQTRINWLLRQVQKARGDVRVEAHYQFVRFPESAKLDELRQNPKLLVSPDASKTLRWFRVLQTGEMGTKRAGLQGSFIGQATDQLLHFYEDVVQGLKPWAGSAPKLPGTRDEDIATQPDNIVEQVSREHTEPSEDDWAPG